MNGNEHVKGASRRTAGCISEATRPGTEIMTLDETEAIVPHMGI